MQRFNSTIKVKRGNCSVCGKFDSLTGGMCHTHYWISVKMKSVAKGADPDLSYEEGLPELIEEADRVFSHWLRRSAANQDGIAECFTCGGIRTWRNLQCGHYIPRSCLYLRHDPRNCRVQCRNCNEFKAGNLIVFAGKLEKEKPGITEILFEESNLVYRPRREEIRSIITEYSNKLKLLK